MLDASKAFDRVKLLTLFKTLYSRGMYPIYLRLLMKIYEEQNMRIRWNNAVTYYFTIGNVVKTGWCSVANIVQFVFGPTHITAQTYWYGLSYEWFIPVVFIYTDDITLLAPSRGIWLLSWNSV